MRLVIKALWRKYSQSPTQETLMKLREITQEHEDYLFSLLPNKGDDK
jgi:hypothetical protein